MKPIMGITATDKNALKPAPCAVPGVERSATPDSERNEDGPNPAAVVVPPPHSTRLAESRARNEADRSSTRRIARTWIEAGATSLIICTGLVWFAEHGLTLNSWLAMGIGVVAGFACYLMFLPWRAIKQMGSDRAVLRELTQRLNRIDLEDRRDPIGSVILQRDDEFGALSQAVHDCLAKAIRHRAEAKMLHRTMHDQIERRTRNATAKLERESLSDALTGVGNRRALDVVRTQLAEAKAEYNATAARCVTALVIDVDYFKQVNDVLGHEAGDEVIISLAELLRSTARRSDVVVRMGGDEFLILIYDAAHNDARKLAERIRSLFAQIPWRHKDAQRPSLTIGIAELFLEENADPVAEVIRRADKALYTAKRAGRNRVQVHSKSAA